jgi:hypothetical protein
MKQILKIGDDCFSRGLRLRREVERARLRARAERDARGAGRARRPRTTCRHDAHGDRRRAARDGLRLRAGGRPLRVPLLGGPSTALRARLIGLRRRLCATWPLGRNDTTRWTLTLSPTDDTNEQLPASAWFSLILGKWSDPKIRADFTLSCGNCHQIGAYRFRRAKTEEQWRSVLTRMMANLPPYFEETRETLVDNVLATYGPNATIPKLPVPPPPSGEILKAVLYEYGLGTADSSPGCHDLELGADNRVYADAGLRWIDPRRASAALPVHRRLAFDRARGRREHVDHAGRQQQPAEVFVDGVTPPAYFPLPNLGGIQGAYPHTNRFDSQGGLWMTLTKSNQLALFDPPTAVWTYHPLPEADPPRSGSRFRSRTAATSRRTTASGGRSSSATASATTCRRRTR